MAVHMGDIGTQITNVMGQSIGHGNGAAEYFLIKIELVGHDRGNDINRAGGFRRHGIPKTVRLNAEALIAPIAHQFDLIGQAIGVGYVIASKEQIVRCVLKRKTHIPFGNPKRAVTDKAEAVVSTGVVV